MSPADKIVHALCTALYWVSLAGMIYKAMLTNDASLTVAQDPVGLWILLGVVAVLVRLGPPPRTP